MATGLPDQTINRSLDAARFGFTPSRLTTKGSHTARYHDGVSVHYRFRQSGLPRSEFE